MADANLIQDEANRLQEVLTAEKVHPLVLEEGFTEFSNASKNALVARVARTFAPHPSGKLLARLLFIRTADNEAAMRTAFVANLRSPDAEARKASLYGLAELGHEALQDLALLSMRDEADQVLTAALNILLPIAKETPNLWAYLQNLYTTLQGKETLHMSLSLLEAHGIAPPRTEAD